MKYDPLAEQNVSYNINYRVDGDRGNPPIILVHGFGANANHFRHNIPRLARAGYRVFAIDLSGFGASDKPKNVEYSIDLWVDLLSSFIRDMTHEHYYHDGEENGTDTSALGVTDRLDI